MQRQSGNFLLQSLFALTLIFAFIPFMAKRIVARDVDAQMFSATRQVETVQTAARIYIREQASQLPYETTVLSGNDLADVLEPYGLPLGFVPRNSFGQDISLIISKSVDSIAAQIELSGGKMSGLQRAELARRIGFYASPTDVGVSVGILLEDVYSDVVRRNETNLENSAFLTDLDMGKNTLDNVGALLARRGEFNTAQFNTLTITGTENGRKVRSNIKGLTTTKTVFQSASGESALSLTRGVMHAKSLTGRTIARFGDTGNFSSSAASVYDFSMTAGRTAFTGPEKWTIRGNVVTDKINFSVERLDVNSFVNVSRGQDVYIDAETLEYNSKSGIEVGTLSTSNITLRDQTSNALATGGTGAVVLDIRPAETSYLPDALVKSINNDNIEILANPSSDDDKTVSCKNIIAQMGGRYNQSSLSQYLICQYMFWQRLEQRINIKQCMLDGGSDCK